MAIQIRCQSCGSKVQLSSKYLGKKVSCPNCQSQIKVPGEETIEAQRQRRAAKKRGAVKDAPIKVRISEPLNIRFYFWRLLGAVFLLVFFGGPAYLLLSYGVELAQGLSRGNALTLERASLLIASLSAGIIILGGLTTYLATATTSISFSESIEIRSILKTKRWDWNDVAYLCFFRYQAGTETIDPEDEACGVRIGRKDGSRFQSYMSPVELKSLCQFMRNSGLLRLLKTRPAPEKVEIFNVLGFGLFLVLMIPIVVLTLYCSMIPISKLYKGLVIVVGVLAALAYLRYIVFNVPYRVTLDNEIKAKYLFRNEQITKWADVTLLTYIKVRLRRRAKMRVLTIHVKEGGQQISWISLIDPRVLPDLQAIALEQNPEILLQFQSSF
ncbi:MAG: hypothetical protein P1V97_38250 [Planctomycetota bacterium]|nr:hypothetical protein [Planctomycetota bacterium]